MRITTGLSSSSSLGCREWLFWADWSGLYTVRDRFQSFWRLVLSESQRSWVSRCMYLLRRLWPLSWRVVLLVVGVWWAELSFIADKAYTDGSQNLNLYSLQRAADLFPYSSYYRMGPAQLVIRDNVWYTWQEGLAIIDQTLRYDPHNRYLKAWRGQMLIRQQFGR